MRLKTFFSLVSTMTGLSVSISMSSPNAGQQAVRQSSDHNTGLKTLASGSVPVPAGSFTLHSKQTGWTGAITVKPVTISGVNILAGSLIAFDGNGQLRTVESPFQNTVFPSCRLLDEHKHLITPPSVPGGPLAAGREIIGPTISKTSSIVQLASALSSRILNSETGSVTQPLQKGWKRVTAGTQWDLAGMSASPATFFDEMTINANTVIAILSLDDLTVGTTVLPPGTCMTISGTVFSESFSPTAFKNGAAVVSPASFAFWNDDLTLQSYIADSVQIGQQKIPPKSQILNLWPSVLGIRPSAPVNIGGIKVDSTAFAFFSGDKLLSAWLADSWKTETGDILPRGTYLTFDETSNHLIGANFYNATTIRGLGLMGSVTFFPNGSVWTARLTKATPVGSVDCDADAIAFYETGQLSECTLASQQLVNGTMWQPKPTAFLPSGAVIDGFLAQDLSLGKSVFHAGDHFHGTYDDSTVLPLIDAADFPDVMVAVKNQINTSLIKGFVDLKDSGIGVFGDYSESDISLQSLSSESWQIGEVGENEPHAFVQTRKYAITNFLKNPPFRDCDCRVTLTSEFKWAVLKPTSIITSGQGGQNQRSLVQTVSAVGEIRPDSQIIIDTNFCPTTYAAYLLARLLFPFYRPVATIPGVSLGKLFPDSFLDDFKKAIILLDQQGNIVPGSVVIDDVYYDNNAMLTKASFSRTIQ